MMKDLQLLLAVVGLGGLVALLAFVPIKKAALGCILSAVGALFPQLNLAPPKAEKGSGSISLGNFLRMSLNGSPRVLLVLAGIVLIAGSILEAHELALLSQQHEQEVEAERREELTIQLAALADKSTGNRRQVIQQYLAARRVPGNHISSGRLRQLLTELGAGPTGVVQAADRSESAATSPTATAPPDL